MSTENPDIKTPYTHPDHPVVGHYFAGPSFSRNRSEIYFCDSYDPRVDYFMTNVYYPDERKDVSVRALGRTYHEAYDKGTYWHVPSWGSKFAKIDLLPDCPALTADNVRIVFENCLYNEGEDTTGHIPVEAVINKFGLNPARVESNKCRIGTLLDQLPDDFKVSGGGGMSFLQACLTQKGDQWGEHVNIEQLLVLGIAAGYAKFLLSRNMWDILPGGMPYFAVDTTGEWKATKAPEPVEPINEEVAG